MGTVKQKVTVESIVISSANEYNLSPEDIRSNTNDETDPLQTPVAKKQKVSKNVNIETGILKHIENVSNSLNDKPSEKDPDEVVLFCESLIPQLRGLDTRKFREVKN